MMMAGSETTLGKFKGSVHERMMEATSSAPMMTDTIAVFTNKSDAKAVNYDDYYVQTAADPSIGTATDRPGLTGLVSGMEEDGVLDLDENAAMVKANSRLFSADEFPAGDRQTFTYTEGDRKFDGMFNGVAGEYACTVASCTAMSDKDGNLVDLTGEWTFKPDADDLSKVKIAGVDHDTDYLAFGYWLRTTEEDGEDPTYGVGTFATGAQPYLLTMVPYLPWCNGCPMASQCSQAARNMKVRRLACMGRRN